MRSCGTCLCCQPEKTRESSEKEDRERGIDQQDVFHRVVLFLAAITPRLFRSIFGSDDAPCGAGMGERGAAGPAAGAEGVRATGGHASASGTPTPDFDSCKYI